MSNHGKSRMYRWEMPTERITRELDEKLSIKDARIARLETRMAALEAFVPEGVVVGDDGTVSVSIAETSL